MTNNIDAIQEDDIQNVPNVDEYVSFIQQLYLDRIWMKSSRVTNSLGGDLTLGASVVVSDSSKWNDSETGFQAFHKYTAEFKNDKGKRLGKVEVEFGLDFDSEEAMTDEMFALFAENNLPLNTWPYLREFLASTVTRMGWIPFTLPARKLSGPVSSSHASHDEE